MSEKTSVHVWIPVELAGEIDEAAAAQVPRVSRSSFLAFVLDRSLSGRARETYEGMVAEERRARDGAS